MFGLSTLISYKRRLGTERDSARRLKRIFATSLTGDVTSEIAEDDWERGWDRASVHTQARFSGAISLTERSVQTQNLLRSSKSRLPLRSLLLTFEIYG